MKAAIDVAAGTIVGLASPSTSWTFTPTYALIGALCFSSRGSGSQLQHDPFGLRRRVRPPCADVQALHPRDLDPRADLRPRADAQVDRRRECAELTVQQRNRRHDPHRPKRAVHAQRSVGRKPRLKLVEDRALLAAVDREHADLVVREIRARTGTRAAREERATWPEAVALID